jgi:hypothetical protein
VDPAVPETRVGAPYPLLFTRFEVDVTRQVTGCGERMKALVKASIKSVTSAPDPKQWFVLDTNSLANAWKTSEVKLEYFPNGAVSTLNASAEDRTAETISNVLGSVVKLVSIGAAPGAMFDTKLEACSPATLESLKVIAAKTPVVVIASKAVEARTEEMALVAEKAKFMGANVDANTKAALSKAYESLLAATADLDDKTKAVDKALKATTFVETVRWPDDGDSAAGELAIPRGVLTRWGAVDSNPNSLRQFSVHFKLAGLEGTARDLGRSDIAEPKLGLPYRQPTSGKFTVCAGGACSDQNLPIAEKVGDVLQMGYIYYLPCESRPFTSVACTFAMTEAGQVKSMGTAQKASVAEALSGVAKDTALQLGTLQETLSGAKAKKLANDTALNKAQADYDASVAALQADPTGADADAAKILAANTALLGAQLANLNALAALADAQAKAAAKKGN